MAASHAFPVKGQAERVRVQFFVAATDAPFSGTLTGLSATVSKDDGTHAVSANVPVQTGSSSWGYLDLSADEMTAGSVVVTVSCTNVGVVAAGLEIVPLDLSGSYTTRYDGAGLSSLFFEQMLKNVHTYLWDRNVDNGAAQIIYNDDGFLMGQGNVVEGNSTAERSKLV